jgi:pilus assembly protein CpaB
VAAVAVFLISQYVGGLKDKAYGNAKRVKVYMVKQDIPRGTYGQEAQAKAEIVQTEIAQQWYPPNAITNLKDIQGQVAVADLSTNQIVVKGMFADPSTVNASLASRLNPVQGADQVAVTIQVDQVHGVAGLLQPGDYVNVMELSGSSGGATGGALFPGNARYVYQKVLVLAVGASPVSQPGDTQAASAGGSSNLTPRQNSGLITLMVPAEAAQRVASLEPSNIYLTLVSPDYKPVPLPPLTNESTTPAENGSALTPYGPKGMSTP